MKLKQPETLKAPERHFNISDKAKWLAGEGAGSWFTIEVVNGGKYLIMRFSQDGILECQSVFSSNNDFEISSPFDFYFPSHCLKVTIMQNGNKITFKKTN
tara:strand:+ start:220 stop:519 length:300 start_codon:yes stop_codon:yes gene_type:complete